MVIRFNLGVAEYYCQKEVEEYSMVCSKLPVEVVSYSTMVEEVEASKFILNSLGFLIF